MNTSLSRLKGLRIHQRFSLLQLANLLLCNRVIKQKFIVANAFVLYRVACFFPGKWLTNRLIAATLSKMFTVGDNLDSLNRHCQHFANQNIPTIIDYCAKGVKDHLNPGLVLDNNAQGFTHSASAAASDPATPPGPLHKGLRPDRPATVEQVQPGSAASGQDLAGVQSGWSAGRREAVQADAADILWAGGEDLLGYLQTVHGFVGTDPRECRVDEIEFKMNHQPYYLYETDKNNLLMVKLLFPLDQQEKKQMSSFTKRVSTVLDCQFSDPNNLKVLGDAEQTYLQEAIENIFYQIKGRYNQSRVYLISIVQSYLKGSSLKLQTQIEVAKRRNQQLGVKLVRGAYYTEETLRAKQRGYGCPVQDCFEKTTDNFLRNFNSVLKSVRRGEVFLGTHNELTVKALLQLKRVSVSKMRVSFAQLYGLGDQLTILLKLQNQTVYKLFPWAETDLLVPYLLRRSEEMTHTALPLSVQYSLLKHELRVRILGF